MTTLDPRDRQILTLRARGCTLPEIQRLTGRPLDHIKRVLQQQRGEVFRVRRR